MKKDTQTGDLFRSPPRGCKAVDLGSGRVVGSGEGYAPNRCEKHGVGYFNVCPECADDLEGMVRRDDHSTSVAAAVGVVKRDKSKLQREVLTAFAERGPMTDAELEALPQFAKYAYSTVRKRRTELFQNGDLVAATYKRVNSHGSEMKVWRLK